MSKKRGRTNRIRKEKIALKNSNSQIFREDLIILSKWMGENGFKSFKKLKPKYFEESGRGLMAEEKISPGDIIISIPERLLITPSKVLNLDLGDYFKRYLPKANGHQVLCVFLMLEKIKSKLSKWHPYLSFLPQTYDIPAYFSSYMSFKPPAFLDSFILKQINLIKTSYEQLIPMIKALELSSPIFHDSLSFELYKWSWCTVNTRCVYIDCFQKFCAGKSCSFHLALVPYLDLLNHNPEVQVNMD